MFRSLLAGCCLAFCASLSLAAETGELLETIRAKHDLPALTVIVIKDGKVFDQAAVGVRKSGEATPVKADDLFHIGSCTKSMTATLAGIFIDEGKLKWETTIGEVFPELKKKIQPEYAAVTVEQLLQNRGGLATEPPAAAWMKAGQQKGTATQQRLEFITAALGEKPAAPPGTKMVYSNQGYTVAGAMLEKIAKKPWEEIMKEKLFQPLKMKSAGFGPPGAKGKIEQPWGHTRDKQTNKPSQSDNPPAIAPAGRVHCNLSDFASYVQLHLQSSEVPQLLQPATLTRLHTPPAGEDYAAGWIVLDRPWAGGKALMHNGSNTMWFAVMWLAPNKKFAVISATNIGGAPAEKGCDDVAAAMIGKWLK